jgi:hypothetical protein
MILELNLTLEDTEDNVLRLSNLDNKMIVKVNDLEYEVFPEQVIYNTGLERVMGMYSSLSYQLANSHRMLFIGRGVNKKEKDIREATALVNKKKEEYKGAQRKLSELNGPNNETN